MANKTMIPDAFEAEAGLLGNILMYPDSFQTALNEKVSSIDFYDEKNRVIWDAMYSIYNKEEAITANSVMGELTKQGLLGTCVDPVYIADLMRAGTFSAATKGYASQIKEASLRRTLMSVGNKMIADAGDTEKSLDSVISEYQNRIMNAVDHLGKNKNGGSNDRMCEYVKHNLLDDLKSFQAIRLQTGFEHFDSMLNNCIYPGVYVVAAISSLGKTTLMHQIADQMAEAGSHVIYFSLEQSKMELLAKSLSRRVWKVNRKKISSLRIRQTWYPNMIEDDVAVAGNNITVEEVRYLNEAFDWYCKKVAPNFDVCGGTFDCTISEIRSSIRRYITTHDDKPVVFVDYLQIIQPEKNFKGTDKQHIDNVMTQLERTAKQEGVTIFGISSLNRGSYLTPVSFESLKEAGSLEYSSDVVWGLQLPAVNDYREKDDKVEIRAALDLAKSAIPRQIELHVLKNRYGRSDGRTFFRYYPDCDCFENVASRDELEKSISSTNSGNFF